MTAPKVNRSLVVLYTAIALDAVGIGLIFPILPRLLAEVADGREVASTIGIIAALYAVMQFVFSPVLGALSDRLGRRPVMLASIAGATLDYVVMACAPQLWLIVLGRAIAGLTSANMAVAGAYLTDVTPEDQRAPTLRPVQRHVRRRLHRWSGSGRPSGAITGSDCPFFSPPRSTPLISCWRYSCCPSRIHRRGRSSTSRALNPLRSLGWLHGRQRLLPVMLVYFALSAGGEAYAVCWALWGFDAFHWNGLWIGLSLGTFGVCQTLTQAILPGPATKLLGERGAVITGIVCSCVALIAMAFADHGWMVFAAMPLFALAGIGIPAFQALATRQVDTENQGQLQGVLAATVSLASIVAPLGFSIIYGGVRQQWPGAVWLAVAAVNVVALPFVLLRLRTHSCHSQKMTIAAMTMADMKVWAQRS